MTTFCAVLSSANLCAASSAVSLTHPTTITYTFTDALKQYIDNNPGAINGKNIDIHFNYWVEGSDAPAGWGPSWNLVNQSWETVVNSLQNINNYGFQFDSYAGMDTVFLDLPLDTPDNSLKCSASPAFDRDMQYNALAFTVDYDKSAPGHCTIHWTAD